MARGELPHGALQPRYLCLHGVQVRQLLLDGEIGCGQPRDLLLLLHNCFGLVFDCLILLFEGFDQNRNEILIPHLFIACPIRGHRFGQHGLHVFTNTHAAWHQLLHLRSPQNRHRELIVKCWGTFPPLALTKVFIPDQDIRLGGVFIGEFGIGHKDSFQGRALQWIQALMAYMGGTSSWTYWSLNPNSGDTGGILQDDWVSVQQWKLDLLTPYQARQFPTEP